MLGRTPGCVRRKPAVSLHGSPALLPAPLATRTLVLTYFCPPRTVYNHHLLSVTYARCVCLARRFPVTVLALALFSLCPQGCFFVWGLGIQPRRVLPLSTPTPRARCRGARMRGRAVWDCRTEVWAPSSGTYFLRQYSSSYVVILRTPNPCTHVLCVNCGKGTCGEQALRPCRPAPSASCT